MPWAKGGMIARLGLLLSGVSGVLTGDIPFVIICILTKNLHTLPSSGEITEAIDDNVSRAF
jgi:hypothetical protein